MEATGIVRIIDNLGRIVIPKKIRTRCGIKEGDPFEIFIDGTTLILQKYNIIMNYDDSFQETVSDVKDNERK